MLVIFDYDGVIADSLEHMLVFSSEVTQRLGIGRALTRRDLEEIENLSFEEMAAAAGIPCDDAAAYVNGIVEANQATLLVPAVFPGMAAVLETVAAEHHVAIVTANLEKRVRHLLALSSLDHCVSQVLDCMAPGSKADKIKRLTAGFGCDAQFVCMVGDAVSDIRAGKSAGARTIAVTWGYQPRARLLKEAPDFIADTPEELIAAVARFKEAAC